MLYNQELKERFIETFDNEKTKKYYRDIFKRIKKFEDFNNADIHMFNFSQLKDMFFGIDSKKLDPLSQIKSFLKSYIIWAKITLGDNNQILYIDMFTTDVLEQCINKTAVQEQYLRSREDLYSICDKCANRQDAVLLVLNFEGLKSEEIANLEISHVHKDTNILELTNKNDEKRIISIHPNSMDVVLKAIKENDYRKKNGSLDDMKQPTMPIPPSVYVIKQTKKANAGAKCGYDIQISRLKKTLKLIKKSYLNPNNLYKSGLFCKMKEIEDAGELTIDTFIEGCKNYDVKVENYFYKIKREYEMWKNAK